MGYGVLTLRPGMCCSASRQHVYSHRNFIRGKKKRKTNSKNACACCVKRPTYNMPEKHQQFARPNNAEKMIGTVTRKDRSVSMMMMKSQPIHPSFLPAAALITNTRHDASWIDGTRFDTYLSNAPCRRRTTWSAHQYPLPLVLRPRNRAMRNTMHHVMHGVLAYQGKVVQPKPAVRTRVSDIASLSSCSLTSSICCLRALIRLIIFRPPSIRTYRIG
jgi:hypothetical protein